MSEAYQLTTDIEQESLLVSEISLWNTIIDIKEDHYFEKLESKKNFFARLFNRDNEEVGFHTLLQDPVYNQAHIRLNDLDANSLQLNSGDSNGN